MRRQDINGECSRKIWFRWQNEKKIYSYFKTYQFYTSVNIKFYTKWLKTEDFLYGTQHYEWLLYFFMCTGIFIFSVGVISKYNENTFIIKFLMYFTWLLFFFCKYYFLFFFLEVLLIIHRVSFLPGTKRDILNCYF